MEMMIKTDFKTIHSNGGSHVALDYDNEIVRIEWHGTMDEVVARDILSVGGDQIEKGQATRILLDRRNLKEFTTGARIWIKNDLLKNRAKALVKKVSKVATINSTSPLGSIFSNLISTAVKLVYTNLSMEKFGTEEEAIKWLLE